MSVRFVPEIPDIWAVLGITVHRSLLDSVEIWVLWVCPQLYFFFYNRRTRSESIGFELRSPSRCPRHCL